MLARVDQLVPLLHDLGGFESLGTGAKLPTMYLNLRSNIDGAAYSPLLPSPRRNKLSFRLSELASHPILGRSDVVEELEGQFAIAAGVSLSGGSGRDRWVPMSVLLEDGRPDQLLMLLDWVRDRDVG